MLSPEFRKELRSSWLPNLTDCALSRLIDLLEKASPLLISGCFTRAVPMGCLASHAASVYSPWPVRECSSRSRRSPTLRSSRSW